MKLNGITAILVLMMIFCSCQEKKQTEQVAVEKAVPAASTVSAADKAMSQLSKHSWLLGKHKRTNGEPGVQSQEAWTRKGDNAYQGLAITTQDGKSKVEEVMTLVASNWGLNFVVQHGNHDPVTFKVIQESENSFTCENKENDFPKQIHYEMRETGLYAKISGGAPDIEYTFSPMNTKQ